MADVCQYGGQAKGDGTQGCKCFAAPDCSSTEKCPLGLGGKPKADGTNECNCETTQRGTFSLTVRKQTCTRCTGQDFCHTNYTYGSFAFIDTYTIDRLFNYFISPAYAVNYSDCSTPSSSNIQTSWGGDFSLMFYNGTYSSSTSFSSSLRPQTLTEETKNLVQTIETVTIGSKTATIYCTVRNLSYKYNKYNCSTISNDVFGLSSKTNSTITGTYTIQKIYSK